MMMMLTSVAALTLSAPLQAGRDVCSPGYFCYRLEPSMKPATPEECRRAQPYLGLPAHVISFQSRSTEPWVRRTCLWRVHPKPKK